MRTKRKPVLVTLKKLTEEDPKSLYASPCSKREIGLGLFTVTEYSLGEYICEYKGEVLTALEADEREQHGYLFYFEHDGQTLCIDAFNKEKSGIARYANDNWIDPNARVVKEVVDGKPRLYLKCIRKIVPGEEIRYDYNDNTAPWREKRDGDSDINKPEEEVQNDRDNTCRTTHGTDNVEQSDPAYIQACQSDNEKENTDKLNSNLKADLELAKDYQSHDIQTLDVATVEEPTQALLNEGMEEESEPVNNDAEILDKENKPVCTFTCSLSVHDIQTLDVATVEEPTQALLNEGMEEESEPVNNDAEILDKENKQLKRNPGNSDAEKGIGSTEQKYKKFKTTDKSEYSDETNTDNLNPNLKAGLELAKDYQSHDIQTLDVATVEEPTQALLNEGMEEESEPVNNDAEILDKENKPVCTFTCSLSVHDIQTLDVATVEEPTRALLNEGMEEESEPVNNDAEILDKENKPVCTFTCSLSVHDIQTLDMATVEEPTQALLNEGMEEESEPVNNDAEILDKENKPVCTFTCSLSVHDIQTLDVANVEEPTQALLNEGMEEESEPVNNDAEILDKENKPYMYKNLQTDTLEKSSEVLEELNTYYMESRKTASSSNTSVTLEENIEPDIHFSTDEDIVKDLCAKSDSSKFIACKAACEGLGLFREYSCEEDFDSDNEQLHIREKRKWKRIIIESDSEDNENNDSEGCDSDTSEVISQQNYEGTKLYATTAKKRIKEEKEKRVYDKREACYYCHNLFTDVRKHLFSKHDDEIEVACILSKKVGSAERKKLLELLICKGNFYHNKEVLDCGRGLVILVRRPSEGKEIDLADYGPCSCCLGFFFKVELHQHQQKYCPAQTAEMHVTSKDIIYSSDLLLGKVSTNASVLEKEVFPTMLKDQITSLAKGDPLIREFGLSWYMKTPSMDPLKRNNHASQKMREVSRLLQVLQSTTKTCKQIADFLSPESFDLVTDAVRSISGFTGSEVPKPSLALKLGYSLKRLAYMKKSIAIKNWEERKEKEADKFLQLYETE